MNQTSSNSKSDPELSDWFYFSDGHRKGPTRKSEIEHLIQSGVLTRHTFVWRTGLSDWVAAEHAGIRLLPPVYETGFISFLKSKKSIFIGVAAGFVFVALFGLIIGAAAIYAVSEYESAQDKSNHSKRISNTASTSRKAMPLTLESLNLYIQEIGRPFQEYLEAQAQNDLTKPASLKFPGDSRFPNAGRDIEILKKMGYDYNLSIREIAIHNEALSSRAMQSMSFIMMAENANKDRELLLKSGIIDNNTFEALSKAFAAP